VHEVTLPKLGLNCPGEHATHDSKSFRYPGSQRQDEDPKTESAFSPHAMHVLDVAPTEVE
jgi:hypothetical protein